MTKQLTRGIGWGLAGVLLAAYALSGALGWAYQLIPSEPLTLSLGCGGCVISLIGIVRAMLRQTGWVTAWLVLAFWLALLGAVMDALLLWFGLTVTGFY